MGLKFGEDTVKGAGLPPVTHPDASSVVLNLNELQSAVFHRHLDVGGLGIQTATHYHSY